MKFYKIFFIYILIAYPITVKATEASKWLKKKLIRLLLHIKVKIFLNENRFLMIEQTINNNFAGTGIAKFVAGKSWKTHQRKLKQNI